MRVFQNLFVGDDLKTCFETNIQLLDARLQYTSSLKSFYFSKMAQNATFSADDFFATAEELILDDSLQEVVLNYQLGADTPR
jgi:hypothetical protein